MDIAIPTQLTFSVSMTKAGRWSVRVRLRSAGGQTEAMFAKKEVDFNSAVSWRNKKTSWQASIAKRANSSPLYESLGIPQLSTT
jgi:hypothetical protein